MEYNSQRPRLIISEYGRHIQRMIDEAVKTPDREERNKKARYIISVMGQLNPQLRDQVDFKHKLWDHLFIMSDFKLDVDSPYPIPTRESFKTKPDKLHYPSNHIKFRHYGKIVERIIDKVNDMEEGFEKDALLASTAFYMKKSYLTWNRDSVDDEVIFNDLSSLSGKKLKMPEGAKLAPVSEILANPNYPQQSGKKFGKSKQKQQKFKRKFGGGNSY